MQGDGSWAVELMGTAVLQPGTYEVQITCTVWVNGASQTSATYQEQPYVVTAPISKVRLSSSSIPGHGLFQVSSATPCPRADEGVQIDITGADGVGRSSGRPQVTMSAGGSWSIRTSADDFDLPANRSYTVDVRCTAKHNYDGTAADMETELEYSPAALKVQPLRWASLGDSYSSGEGNPPFDSGTHDSTNACHRSSLAWPRLLGTSKSLHIACSGAVVRDLTHQQPQSGSDNDPQAGQLADAVRNLATTHKGVDIVTLTISGNDAGFSGILEACRLHNCVSAVKAASGRLGTIRPRLTAGLLAVSRADPRAQIFLVGYPQIFPTNSDTCGWLSDAERNELNKLGAKLETMERNAAEDTGDYAYDFGAPGINFISVKGALKSHELCTKNSWVYPITALKHILDPKSQLQGHPTERGQEAIAEIVGPAISHDTYVNEH